ncbi:MAG: tRNA pseudouridine(38-40) synthase TruA [Treponema sp.]|nr:tRNA pseudouridine(38-40) synthase TruA [Treponema sp.]
MTERNIRLVVAYDGTDFSGWQRQKKQRTVQEELEKVLRKIHKHPAAVTGSGRTDAGVHAIAQCANFYTDISNMEAKRFVPAINGLLPKDIRILDACETVHSFHARFDALSRTYRYFFIANHQALPMERRYALQLWRQPDISLLNDYCRFLRGEFDCTVFASSKDKSNSRYRYIFDALFFTESNRIIFEIRANAFLWRMVRSIAGTLLFYEERKTNPDDFFKIISSGNRALAGTTLPPEGLFLWNVEYYSAGEN